MRCPSCTERNSVAARKCEYCGERFKRKPLPVGLKVAAGGIVLALTTSILASYMVPRLIDPEQNLARAAKRAAVGPKSGDDAKHIKKEFGEHVKAYLKQIGSAKPPIITAALQKSLQSTAFEVHVVELPRGMKIVEIDTLLQATDFLVMNTHGGTKVFDLPDFEVFDDARILNDSAGPILALLGHSGGQPPHRPHLRAYALLPDYVSDETEKLVPMFAGEGNARFDKNGRDVKLELSLQTIAKADNIAFDTGTRDETIHELLRWKDAKYVQTADLTSSASGIAFEVAQSLHHPDVAHTVHLSPAIVQFIKNNAKQPNQQLIIANMGAKKGQPNYRVGAGNTQFVLTMQKDGNGQYGAADIRVANQSEMARLTPIAPVVPNTGVGAVRQASAPAPTVRTIAASPAPQPTVAATPARTATAPVASATTPPPQPAPAAGVTNSGGADRKIVVRGLTDEGTKLAANMPAAEPNSAMAAPTLSTSPKQTVSGLAATAKAVADKLKVKTEGNASRTSSKDATTPAIVSGAFGCTLRTAGSLGARPLRSLSKGEALDVISKEGDWYHVRYQGREGYVYSPLITTTGDASSKNSERRRNRRDSVVFAQTQNQESGRNKRSRRHDSNSNRIAMAAPEQTSSRRREERRKSTSGQNRSSSRNRVRMAAVEPILVP